ncbi:MAG: hypothetical protein CMI09_02790 [Oceanospirillaceae bacterium]|nr:hypothetical protein [Oceanospirillaceae bacterium]
MWKPLIFATCSLALTGCFAVATGGSACCDSASQTALPMKQELHCQLEEGVILADDMSSVVVSLGWRPTLGYRVRVEDEDIDGTEVYLGVREIKPASDLAVAQVTSSPCLTVTLPDDWTVLVVENTESDRVRRFTSGR